jgi:hypothetical protein
MRMKTRGETTFVAPKEQARNCESLRQKNTCLTQLWRVLQIRSHQRGKPIQGIVYTLVLGGCIRLSRMIFMKLPTGKLSGARTETSLY